MRLQYHLPCTTPPFVQRTLAPRRPHDWAEVSDAPIMAAMADTAAIMTTSFFMNTPFRSRCEIRPKLFYFAEGSLSFNGAPFTRVTLPSCDVPMVLETSVAQIHIPTEPRGTPLGPIWVQDDEVAKMLSLGLSLTI